MTCCRLELHAFSRVSNVCKSSLTLFNDCLADVVLPLPNAASVFMIEGLGQQSYGGLNWGDGLITQQSVIQQYGLSDPKPFFQQLLASSYRRQVIVAVHVYPPAISKVGIC